MATEELGSVTKLDVRRARNREHARLSRERKRKQMEFLEEENTVIRRELQEARNQRNHLSALLSQSEQENTRLRAWIDTVYYPDDNTEKTTNSDATASTDQSSDH
mmetsp:Transcript_37507/g.120321  ORF Transcript_37507/g.120321 Transcript_37507/m.120321 type:complete len:105 (+) Transcript_37507:102-416(+)